MVIFFVLLSLTAILFVTDWLRADFVALAFMLSLIVSGLLTPDEAFQGFGSETVLLFIGLLTMTAALRKTGVVEHCGRLLLRLCGEDPEHILLGVMVLVSLISTFMSNTAAAAFFLPVVFAICRKLHLSPSRYLLPLAFSSILTSSVTLISTSTNIVVSGVMTRNGMEPMGLFELAPVGIPIAITGVAYMWLIGRRLLKDRTDTTGPETDFGLRPYLCDMIILEDSPLVGKTLTESNLGKNYDLTVLRIVRKQSGYIYPRFDVTLKAEDVLLVEGSREAILRIKDTPGIEIKSDAKLLDPSVNPADLSIVEAIVLPHSRLIGRSIKTFRLLERLGVQAIGMTRAGETLKTKLSDIRVKMGDFFLLQGPRSQIEAAESMRVFDVLGSVDEERLNYRKAALCVSLFIAALALAAFKILPTAVAFLCGAVAVVASRCLTAEEALSEIDWGLIVLVGSMLSAGVAMEKTGAVDMIATYLTTLSNGGDTRLLIAGFFVVAVVLTQIMSNQAAAVVLVPIAIQTATSLDLNPRTFVFTIAIASSCSYLTPLEPACLLVYGPGGYKFSDFLRVGGLLTMIVFAVTMLLVPLIWPL